MIRKNAVSVILLLTIMLTIAIRWMGFSGENYRSIIISDGHGYYQYYESLLGQKSMLEQEANGTFLVYTPDSTVVNKYFVGLPILWAPFVMPVYAYYELTSVSEIDFYAEGFQKAISLAALFYLFMGLIALKKLLQSFNFEERVINFSIFAFFFGTNLSYYTIIAPSMSHVYSFALIAGFLYWVRIFSIKQIPLHLIFIALIFGLIVLVRPTNGIVLFAIPMIWEKELSLVKFLKHHIKLILVVLFLLFMIIAIQPLFWYLQTGSLLQWSYAGEGFYFTHPQIIDFVIGYRKGFLVYTPILLLSLFSLILLFKQNRQQFAFSLGFIFILIYILSSWWNWYYGDSYGSRVMIDFYSIFILLFALGLQKISRFSRILWLAFGTVFIFLNIFQSYQYYHNIMSHYDMNSEKYSYIFLKVGKEYENRLGGNDDIAPYHKKPMKLLFEINNRKLSADYRVSCSQPIEQADTVQVIYTLVKGESFPCTISLAADSLLNYKALYVDMICTTYNEGPELGDVYWTTSIRSSSEQPHYYVFRINGTPERINGFRNDRYRFSLPVPMNNTDEVLISLWNKGNRSFAIQNLIIKVYGITE